MYGNFWLGLGAVKIWGYFCYWEKEKALDHFTKTSGLKWNRQFSQMFTYFEGVCIQNFMIDLAK